ncbi:MAG: pro-sigmaK processing inhibitor BofA family protein [Eubacterium sp.]|jgi:hypothetical protein|nr:pro-sigmaK processing inhibitor BofA family protein [Eubacterium sp.]
MFDWNVVQQKLLLIFPAILPIFFISVSMKHKNPVRAAVLNMILGVAGLIAASFILKALGMTLFINFFTVFSALTLGLPGVVAMVLFILS